jgi:hypothetical protein
MQQNTFKILCIEFKHHHEDGFALEGSVNLNLTHKNIKFLGRINHLQSLGVIFALNESVASSKHVELHLYAV